MMFKKGDKLELINNDNMSALLGATAIVIQGNRNYVYVKWVRDSKYKGQVDGGYFHTDFKRLVIKNQQLLFDFMS